MNTRTDLWSETGPTGLTIYRNEAGAITGINILGNFSTHTTHDWNTA